MQSALTNTVTCNIAFKSTLPAAYNAKFLTAGIGTIAPKANATVSVMVLNKILGPIFATVLATLSSAFKYKGMLAASPPSSFDEERSSGER